MRRRGLGFLLKAPFRRKTYVVLRREVRIYPPIWIRSIWDPCARLAIEALRKGAAQKIRELHRLARLLAARDLRCVVEIGTAHGGTFYALCQLAAGTAVVVSIDLPGGGFGGGYTEREAELFRGYGRREQELHFIRADSHEPTTRDELVRLLGGRSIDLLMIDGDHTYAGVKADFDLYSPLVAHGGLIALHDILPHTDAPACKVDVFWAELKQSYTCTEIVDTYDSARYRGQWGGIGIVHWRTRGFA